jgi:hypothetical protein
LFTFLMELISGVLVILGCLAVAYTICTLAFKRESALDKSFLTKLFVNKGRAS